MNGWAHIRSAMRNEHDSDDDLRAIGWLFDVDDAALGQTFGLRTAHATTVTEGDDPA